MTENLKLLIFDLDGVITSETKYWNTSRLTVWELICSDDYLGLSNYFGESKEVENRLAKTGDRLIPSSFIYELKSRAVNSNWDLTFFVVCLHLVAILNELKKSTDNLWYDILKKPVPVADKFQELGKLLSRSEYSDDISNSLIEQFWEETTSLRGSAAVEYVHIFIEKILGIPIPGCEAKGELWQLCYQNFQDWYEGKKGYQLPDDETVVDVNSIDAALKSLRNSGRFNLAIATGRPRNEVIEPMTVLGLLKYFDRQRIVTYDEVLEAESILSNNNQQIKLGKPHPFVLFKAVYPEEKVEKLCEENFQLTKGEEIAYIGDAGSDVVAAKKAGCFSIGVLTGFAEGKAREMLAGLGCDIILDSILDLPQFLGIANN
ncbi:MAG: HAD hydrolase-like protein [Cyanobacteriota bacterium]|nr:HAD hydrolase-like protein [Cyanobacteriota bacterium]